MAQAARGGHARLALAQLARLVPEFDRGEGGGGSAARTGLTSA
jgi:hypothetical protein